MPDKILKDIDKVIKAVRYGDLSKRIDTSKNIENVNTAVNFNKMIEACEDRERMLEEYRINLLEKTEYLGMLFNLMSEGLMILSEDYKIIRVNAKQVEWLHKSKKDLIGKSIFDVLKKYDISFYDSGEKLTPSTFENKKLKTLKIKVEFKFLKWVFEISAIRFLNKDNTANILVISKNIDSQIELENMKNSFIATLTHDLRVPILAEANVIKLFENKAFGKISTEQKEVLTNMAQNNNDLLNLVNTLLETYKIDDGSYRIRKKPNNIVEVAAKEIAKLKPIADKKGQQLILKAANKIPEIKFDAAEISRVFQNIITNAINYSNTGSVIRIKISSAKTAVKVAVIDNGKGIEPQEINKIFEKYYTTAKKFRKIGTGLGLFLSQRIITMHGGEIKVKSKPDIETVFEFTLPISKS
ncbi:MAG: PAS domain-containing sensor histidine kinase [Candidatus Gastranaerophilales bacterium]|nr:PAS domain-containing sensor histidine kinase [Candidatus Gastranaerophilales bacterium]